MKFLKTYFSIVLAGAMSLAVIVPGAMTSGVAVVNVAPPAISHTNAGFDIHASNAARADISAPDLGTRQRTEAPTQSTERISLHFYERPPLMMQSATGPSGLLIERARDAFTKAGIAFKWEATPAKRQLAIIASGSGLDCGVGWLKNAQREAIGKFTKAIYMEKPTVVIARRDAEIEMNSLESTLDTPYLRVIIKDGLTYGSYVHQLLSHAQANIQHVSVDQRTIANMIALNRGDIMFASPEEAHLLMHEGEGNLPGLSVVQFPDIPPGETRHIFCGPRVSDSVLQRLNAAIQAID